MASEYQGLPSPLEHLDLYLPLGSPLHPAALPTCSISTLQLDGPAGCPRRSRATSIGKVRMAVAFGGERVPEEATLEGFYAPEGGAGALNFFLSGVSPAIVEVPFISDVLPADGSFGPELAVELPLIETVPGAFDALIESLSIKLWVAGREAGNVVHVMTIPEQDECPYGRLVW